MFEEVIRFCANHKITPNEFFFCYLSALRLQDKQNGYGKNPLFYEYASKMRDNLFTTEEVDNLVERGFIHNPNQNSSDPNSRYHLEEMETTEKFHKKWFLDSFIAGEELWNLYPDFIELGNGKTTPAKSTNKEQLIKYYCKAINHNVTKHNQILELLMKDVESGRRFTTMGIEKWVTSHQWDIMSKHDYDADVKDYFEIQ